MRGVIGFTFSPEGAIGRIWYAFGTMVVIWIALVIIMFPPEMILKLAGDTATFKNWVEDPNAPFRVWVYFSILVYQITCLSMKRLRDIGWSPWHALWIAFPLWVGFYLGHIKTADGSENPVSGPLVTVALIVWFVLLVKKGRRYLMPAPEKG